MGTVTHQYIGYLWPMGPFYWVFDQLGVPDWVAQRLWLGTVMFAAGLGVRYLCRTLGWGRRPRTASGDQRAAWGGVLVASLAYMLSPYLLEYSARISVILLPWAALPWLIALTARALRRGGWRYPALFALVVLTVGGINATALIMIGTGPLLYVAWAVFVEHEVNGREALAAMGRIGVLTVGTSLWWIAGLWAEGKYGLPVTRYTETYQTVAEVSSAPGGAARASATGSSTATTSSARGPRRARPTPPTWPRSRSATRCPILAIVAAALVRWRYRALFFGIIVVGAFTAVAAHPWSNPSLARRALQGVHPHRRRPGAAQHAPGRARWWCSAWPCSSAPASPRSDGCGRRGRSRSARRTSVVLFANLSTLWTGQMVADNLKRPEQIPPYWVQAADYLQSQGDATRVLEVPGSDFASYRWGNTVDPVTPGLMDRPYVAHELFQYGSAQSAVAPRRVRHPLRRGRHGPALDRADRPAHGRGRRRRPQRPPVRALPHRPTRPDVAAAHEHAGAGHADRLRPAGRRTSPARSSR